MGYGMGSDVPDDLCYQWSEDYFNDADAEEDKSKDDEFVPKKYYGAGSTSVKQKADAKKKTTATSLKNTETPSQNEQIQLPMGA